MQETARAVLRFKNHDIFALKKPYDISPNITWIWHSLSYNPGVQQLCVHSTFCAALVVQKAVNTEKFQGLNSHTETVKSVKRGSFQLRYVLLYVVFDTGSTGVNPVLKTTSIKELLLQNNSQICITDNGEGMRSWGSWPEQELHQGYETEEIFIFLQLMVMVHFLAWTTFWLQCYVWENHTNNYGFMPLFQSISRH